MSNDDLAFALFLQEQFNNESGDNKAAKPPAPASTAPSSVVDEAWELIDPAPDIRQLFLQFNDEYFDGLLGSVEVRWSPRMTLCAGLCSYEGRGGLCSVRLSEPLLKLRPRKDLVQTLLHEMIHALLFVTQNNKDHDGHGPEFHKHMYRINKQSGSNITVYHNFHDEVDACRQHWWKCDGPCQNRRPFYGVVKRAMNRAPAPQDTWWANHQATCGGTFTKVKEPENYKKKRTKNPDNNKVSKAKENIVGSSKDKGNVLGSKGTPTLPSLFERIKEKNNAKKSTDSEQLPGLPKMPNTDMRDHASTSSQKDRTSTSTSTIVKIDEQAAEGSDEESNLESKAKKQKTEDPEDNIFNRIPFSGKGHVLGSSNHKPDGNRKLPTSDNRLKNTNTRQLDDHSKNNDISQSRKNVSSWTSKAKELKTKEISKGSRNPSVLTIEEAFKIGSRQSKALDASTPLGSRNKPIALSDTPTTSQSPSNVACPVCQALLPATQINSHLDSCLLATL